MDKFNKALEKAAPPPMEGPKVQEVHELRNGGLEIQIHTKIEAECRREPQNEIAVLQDLTTRREVWI